MNYGSTSESVDALTELEEMKKFAKSYQQFDKTYCNKGIWRVEEEMKRSDPDCSILADIDLTVLEERQGNMKIYLNELKATNV